MIVEYDHNNSGGEWWLTDKDWKTLEDAGWHVEWGKLLFCHSTYSSKQEPPICESNKSCKGHRRYNSYEEIVLADTNHDQYGDDPPRFLGALATGAWKEFPSIEYAIEEFEDLTGQAANAEGCNCCGQPHSFWSKDE